MKTVILRLLATLAGLLHNRALLHPEVPALRQQLAVFSGRDRRKLRLERCECADHVIAFNERHLKRLLGYYITFFLAARRHLSSDKQCPEPRPVASPDQEYVIDFP